MPAHPPTWQFSAPNWSAFVTKDCHRQDCPFITGSAGPGTIPADCCIYQR